MNKMVLYEHNADCSGCGACVNICPKGAVFMAEDEYGFLYPKIDFEKCVFCGQCRKVCPNGKNFSAAGGQRVYAAAAREVGLIMKSASGGVFAVMARKILRSRGVVFGATLIYENGALKPRHIFIENEEDLPLLQGSKYVQSDIGTAFEEVKRFLDAGRRVLFSGTPCQVDGLRSFLGRDYDSLITADIICHGVPSARMFGDYIAYYEEKFAGKVTRYSFRDKTCGQGMTQVFTVTDKNKTRSVRRAGELTAYMWEFLRANTYRESCYSCKYASRNRLSDITLGDYWGVYIEHGRQIKETEMDNKKGISCVIVSTPKGGAFFEEIKNELEFFESDIERVARHNAQLNSPSAAENCRHQVLESYKNGGYAGLHSFYLSRVSGAKRLAYGICARLPKGLKRNVKVMLARLRKE